MLETAAREKTEIEKNLLAERAQLEKQLETALEQGKRREIEKENHIRKMIDSGNGIDVKKVARQIKVIIQRVIQKVR